MFESGDFSDEFLKGKVIDVVSFWQGWKCQCYMGLGTVWGWGGSKVYWISKNHFLI